MQRLIVLAGVRLQDDYARMLRYHQERRGGYARRHQVPVRKRWLRRRRHEQDHPVSRKATDDTIPQSAGCPRVDGRGIFGRTCSCASSKPTRSSDDARFREGHHSGAHPSRAGMHRFTARTRGSSTGATSNVDACEANMISASESRNSAWRSHAAAHISATAPPNACSPSPASAAGRRSIGHSLGCIVGRPIRKRRAPTSGSQFLSLNSAS